MQGRRLLFFLVLAAFAGAAYGQFQTGNIYGKVQAKDGSVLPGVTVVLTGIGAPQTAYTDAQGNFRFINLSPGTYTLKAELAGYGSATRSGIGVRVNANADVTLTLNPSVSESITVTAEAPVLDVRKTGTGADISRVEMDKVPTARDPWVILQQTPAVLMDRNNVGGNESGQQSNYVSKGSVATQSTWNVDGVNITDFAATGSSPSYYDFDTFEEIQITTGGTDPRIMTPGTQLNMVTKRGTNDFKGSARYFTTDKSYQADPKIPSEATGYLQRINQINNIADRGAEVGGPIIKDKLWLWGSYGKQDIDILTATLIGSARAQDKTALKSENLKLNAQPLASNSFVAVDQYNAKIKLGRNVGTTRLPATGWNQNNDYNGGVGSLRNPTLWKVEDTQIFGQNLYLTGLYSKVQGGFQLIADNGNGCQSYACGLDSLPSYRDMENDGAWHRTYVSIVSNRPQKQYRIDGSAFANTGNLNHEFKFGYGYRKSTVTSQTGWPGDQFTYNYGSGNVADGGTGYVALMRIPVFTFGNSSTDAYVGDTIMAGNLTVQAGLRYDMQKGFDTAGAGPGNSVAPEVLPALSFPASGTLKWTNVSPRLGLTYTLGADRRTLLRAAYSRYIDQMASGPVAGVSPGAASYLYYYFNDLNHDNIAQRSEIDFDYGPFFFRGVDPQNPANVTNFRRWANNLKAPKTDEIILGGEREVLTDFSIGVNATYRKLTDFVWVDAEKTQGGGDFYTPADYVLHDPVDVTLPNGKTVSVPYYTLRSDVPVPKYYVYRNQPDYNQTYKGLEFTATKRMSNRWMLRGNLTLQDWKQHVGSGAISDPTLQRIAGSFLNSGSAACQVCNNSEVLFRSTGSGNKGNVYINSKWAYSITGAYQIPFIETSVGFNLNGRQGYPLPYVYKVGTPRGEGSKFLMVEGANTDQFRNPNVTELDLRIAKDFRFQRVGLTLSVDGFNILNSNTILQRDVTQLNDNAASNHVTEVLSPRVFRLGARLSF